MPPKTSDRSSPRSCRSSRPGGAASSKPPVGQCKADAGSGSSAPFGLAFLGHLDNGTKPTSQPLPQSCRLAPAKPVHFAAWGPERPRSSQTPETAPAGPRSQPRKTNGAWASKQDGGHPGCTAGPGQTMSSDLGGHNSQPEPLPALLGRTLQTLRSRRQKPAAAPQRPPART